MKKKIIFLAFSLIVSSCATASQEIDQLEEQIVALENKENLTPEEEAESVSYTHLTLPTKRIV